MYNLKIWSFGCAAVVNLLGAAYMQVNPKQSVSGAPTKAKYQQYRDSLFGVKITIYIVTVLGYIVSIASWWQTQFRTEVHQLQKDLLDKNRLVEKIIKSKLH